MGGDGQFFAVVAAKGYMTRSRLSPDDFMPFGNGLQGVDLPVTLRVVFHLGEYFVSRAHVNIVSYVVSLSTEKEALFYRFAVPLSSSNTGHFRCGL